MASLLYGSGLRLLEALRLRVKDVDHRYRQLVARDGRGQKDRVTVLPEVLLLKLRLHLRGAAWPSNRTRPTEIEALFAWQMRRG